MKTPVDLHSSDCTFCHRTYSEVAMLLASPRGAICEVCVAVCVSAMAHHIAKVRPSPDVPDNIYRFVSLRSEAWAESSELPAGMGFDPAESRWHFQRYIGSRWQMILPASDGIGTYTLHDGPDTRIPGLTWEAALIAADTARKENP